MRRSRSRTSSVRTPRHVAPAGPLGAHVHRSVAQPDRPSLRAGVARRQLRHHLERAGAQRRAHAELLMDPPARRCRSGPRPARTSRGSSSSGRRCGPSAPRWRRSPGEGRISGSAPGHLVGLEHRRRVRPRVAACVAPVVAEADGLNGRVEREDRLLAGAGRTAAAAGVEQAAVVRAARRCSKAFSRSARRPCRSRTAASRGRRRRRQRLLGSDLLHRLLADPVLLRRWRWSGFVATRVLAVRRVPPGRRRTARGRGRRARAPSARSPGRAWPRPCQPGRRGRARSRRCCRASPRPCPRARRCPGPRASRRRRRRAWW